MAGNPTSASPRTRKRAKLQEDAVHNPTENKNSKTSASNDTGSSKNEKVGGSKVSPSSHDEKSSKRQQLENVNATAKTDQKDAGNVSTGTGAESDRQNTKSSVDPKRSTADPVNKVEEKKTFEPHIYSLNNGAFIATKESSKSHVIAFLSLPLEEQYRLRSELLKRADEIRKPSKDVTAAEAENSKASGKSLGGAASSTKDSTLPRTCQCCPRTAAYLCSYCCKGWYCSRTCQVGHWPIHRKECNLEVQFTKPQAAASQSAYSATGYSPSAAPAAYHTYGPERSSQTLAIASQPRFVGREWNSSVLYASRPQIGQHPQPYHNHGARTLQGQPYHQYSTSQPAHAEASHKQLVQPSNVRKSSQQSSPTQRQTSGMHITTQHQQPYHRQQQQIHLQQPLQVAQKQGYQQPHGQQVLQRHYGPNPANPLCVVCKKLATCKCSVCGKEYYCGRECQHKAWRTHEEVCIAPTGVA